MHFESMMDSEYFYASDFCFMKHDDDDDDDDEFVVWLTEERRLALFPTGTIVRDPHHLKSPTRHEQDLNLRRA